VWSYLQRPETDLWVKNTHSPVVYVPSWWYVVAPQPAMASTITRANNADIPNTTKTWTNADIVRVKMLV